MARYLLTGAAGFIAARVAEMLLEAGHEVVGVDNLNDAYDVRMKTYRLDRLRTWDSFTFHLIDIAEQDPVRVLGAGAGPFEAVINLAARAGVRASTVNPWIYINTNVTGTLNLLELCRQTGVHKFVLASTSSVYGADAPLPTPEDTDSSHPLQPYAASKKGAESLAHAYHYLYGLDVSVFRYFTVYGPAGRPDMSMFRFVKWISEGQTVFVNGDGEQSRGYTYVDDIARGTILGLKSLGFEIINLGGHENIKINDLIGMISSLVGHAPQVEHRPRHPADALANLANIDKARRLLGWEPQVSLHDGVARLVTWYETERRWAREIRTD